MIQAFQQIWYRMAEWLTEKENHKFQQDFYNSFLTKVCVFQFINQYSIYFFMAIKQRHTSMGCENNDCLTMLRLQLSMTLCCIIAVDMAQVAFGCVRLQLFMWKEDYALKK